MSCGANELCARFVERHRSALNFAALVLGYILYLIIGAGIFSAIELPYEKELRQELRDARRDFLNDSPCVDEERLEKLLTRVLEASNYGVTELGNDSDQNWDFVSSLFFTSTVLTTTGYGHTVPLSDGGKAFCVVYSLFGIPLTLLFLSAVVQRIMVIVTRRPITYFHRHWNFLESLYFCFISLTTSLSRLPGEGGNAIMSTCTFVMYRKCNKNITLISFPAVSCFLVYLLVGLICVLVMLETCCELPQMRRLRQRFYHETSTNSTRRPPPSSTATSSPRSRATPPTRRPR
uniref:Potassium channel domain-containing protein n=1 Tax=Neogobius melanostomus TaxID=47308 RepID=A0A8C6U5F0_9GOBI